MPHSVCSSVCASQAPLKQLAPRCSLPVQLPLAPAHPCSCHVDAFKKGSDGWQKRVAAADAARREFEDLFGDGAAEEEGQEDGAGAAAAGAAAVHSAEAPAEGEAAERPKKKQKGKKAKQAA